LTSLIVSDPLYATCKAKVQRQLPYRYIGIGYQPGSGQHADHSGQRRTEDWLVERIIQVFFVLMIVGLLREFLWELREDIR